MVICSGTAIQMRTKDPFRVQGVGIGVQRSPSQSQNQASRLKALHPNCSTHQSSQMAGRFLKDSTGTGFASFAKRKVPKDLLTHHQSSGITTRRTSTRKTLPDGNVKSSCIRSVCAGNKGTRLQLCP